MRFRNASAFQAFYRPCVYPYRLITVSETGWQEPPQTCGVCSFRFVASALYTAYSDCVGYALNTTIPLFCATVGRPDQLNAVFVFFKGGTSHEAPAADTALDWARAQSSGSRLVWSSCHSPARVLWPAAAFLRSQQPLSSRMDASEARPLLCDRRCACVH